MTPGRLTAVILAAMFGFAPVCAQTPYLSSLAAAQDSPLFTTYAAIQQRSEFTLDKGYHLLLNDPERGADLTNQSGGDISLSIGCGGKSVYAVKDMFSRPVVSASYSDFVTYTYWPFDSIRVNVTFLVYSSRHAVLAVDLTNTGSRTVHVEIAPALRSGSRPYHNVAFGKDSRVASFTHEEPPDEWVLEHRVPYVREVNDAFVVSDLHGRVTTFRSSPRGIDTAHIVGFTCAHEVPPGETRRLVAVRSVARPSEDAGLLVDSARALTTLDLQRCREEDELAYAAIPPLASTDPDLQMLYWGGFSLMRQVMLPPESNCHYNYYVFSREPQWGWGHGGQVFHESLTMLSYAFMDPVGAMNSQRVYMERQKPDGYINYRTGPYLDEEIPYNNQLTTSAPWYAWQNWEIYRVTNDRKFLEEAYASSASFYRYILRNRDSDGEGLCEWGGHAVLESVRDGMVAVWDKVGWPAEFEALDLNAMLVNEARSLTAMAMILGKRSAAVIWEKDFRQRCVKINASMWDSAAGFYFNIDRKTRTFTSKSPGDLKREEIIGFLPLWAGIATKAQAARLVAKLTDTSKFWREYGVPSLAADDPYYNPKGYWNGPVWVQWNYLIVRGLLQYGYVKEARELTRRVARGMIAQLKKDHNFWEFYSPDEPWAGYHRTYIWAGLINRMLIECAQAPE